MQFDIVFLNDDVEDCIYKWLNYGVFNGLGQWRNSGKGAFVWQELDDNNNVINGNAF